MDANDLNRYTANYYWFNRFLQDVKQLLDKVAENLSPDYSQIGTTFYYPKFNYYPSIPPYLLMAMGNDKAALQIFAVLNPEEIGNKECFLPEPSLFIIKHSDKDKGLYPDEYGLKVINSSMEFVEIEKGVIAGSIPGKDRTSFQAFQIPLDLFTADKKTEDIIQERIVKVINRLPIL